MKLNETIELNGKEYTVELNRESVVRIEQYTNLQETAKKMEEKAFIDKSNRKIEDDENPFADKIDDEKLINSGQQKIELLKSVFNKAFWIWLYPEEKLSISEVEKILAPYFEEESKINYIAEKYE